MAESKVLAVGDQLMVALPANDVERLGIVSGQTIEFAILSVDGASNSRLRPELRDALMATWDEDIEAYRYLSER